MLIHGTMQNFNLSDLFSIFVIFGNEKIHFYVVPKQCFHILCCLFFLHKASTCGEDRKRYFCNYFCIIICVLVVQIWITCIKCKENAVNQLNIANEPRKMPNLHSNDFIAYVDHTKNIMFKQRIYLDYLSKFKRFPLETTNLHRRWLDLWRLYMVAVSKPFQIFTTALWCQFMAPCQISTFSDLFSIFVIFGNEKNPFLRGSKTMFSYIALPIFLP